MRSKASDTRHITTASSLNRTSIFRFARHLPSASLTKGGHRCRTRFAGHRSRRSWGSRSTPQLRAWRCEDSDNHRRELQERPSEAPLSVGWPRSATSCQGVHLPLASDDRHSSTARRPPCTRTAAQPPRSGTRPGHRRGTTPPISWSSPERRVARRLVELANRRRRDRVREHRQSAPLLNLKSDSCLCASFV